MEFYKYQGTGNDFILTSENPSCVKTLCDRHFGIGADGLLVVHPSKVADIKMVYYNQDGKVASMCGNGLRCFTRHVHEKGLVKKNPFTVETGAGPIEVGVEDAYKAVYAKIPRLERGSWQKLPTSQGEVSLFKIDTGTLHAVLLKGPKEMAEEISNHKAFPNQINVNYVDLFNRDSLSVTTYEKGVGWTLACGTGVVASALALYQEGLCDAKLDVQVPGGQLNLQILPEAVLLSGPAVCVAKGWYNNDFI